MMILVKRTVIFSSNTWDIVCYHKDMLLKQTWAPSVVIMQDRWGAVWEKTVFLSLQMELGKLHMMFNWDEGLSAMKSEINLHLTTSVQQLTIVSADISEASVVSNGCYRSILFEKDNAPQRPW